MNRALAWTGLGLLLAGLLAYSQTVAFHWDEGFHLLAARSIAAGKTPYVDFCFPQAPLNAYWTAVWFRLLHPGWRLAHALAAIETWLAIALLAGFVRERFPVAAWRGAAALAASSLVGLLLLTWDYGTLAQAYGFCLAALVAAFRCGVAARERRGSGMAFAAGVLASAAASASLLSATAAPVLLVWLWLYNRAGSRMAKAAAFAGGCVIPAIPALRLLAIAPRQTWFNVVEFHMRYRQVGFDNVATHDFEILTSWLLDPQSLLLIALAALGWIMARRSDWAAERREEYRLCLWLAAGITVQNAMSHPTFPQYFVIAAPFLGPPAAAGFYELMRNLTAAKRPMRAAAALSALLVVLLAREMYAERGGHSWGALEPVGRKLDQVTPPGAEILAEESLYFLSGREAPPGMEFQPGHDLDLGPRQNALYRILPKAQLRRDLRAGRFAAAAICANDDLLQRIADSKVYGQKFESGDCTVFWGVRPPPENNVPPETRKLSNPQK